MKPCRTPSAAAWPSGRLGLSHTVTAMNRRPVLTSRNAFPFPIGMEYDSCPQSTTGLAFQRFRSHSASTMSP